MKRLILSLFVTFISFYVASDDAASENVEIEVIEIIGSQEEALEIAGSASVITTEDLKIYEYTDIHKILSTVPGINFRPEEGYGLRPNISIRGTYADRSGKVNLDGGWSINCSSSLCVFFCLLFSYNTKISRH